MYSQKNYWKQSKYLATEIWLSELQYTHTMEKYYAAIKKSSVMTRTVLQGRVWQVAEPFVRKKEGN